MPITHLKRDDAAGFPAPDTQTMIGHNLDVAIRRRRRRQPFQKSFR
jgi:hypothetical protein